MLAWGVVLSYPILFHKEVLPLLDDIIPDWSNDS